VAVAAVLVLAGRAAGQESREPAGTPLPDYARIVTGQGDAEYAEHLPAGSNGLPNIMLTGYWPPTNEMLRRFSTNPEQNPEGWVGENWEGLGYNVYSFFPEFPGGVLGKGEGDFEVDYQDTSADFWPVTELIDPVAIITFGLAGEDSDWELEWRLRNLRCTISGWINDYEDPYKPTPCPPDESQPEGHIRYSTLPMQDIVDAVNEAGLGINAFIDDTTWAGRFLCEFIGYHATWYHDLHAAPGDPAPNVAAGHIHVGSLIDLPEAIAAAEITVRSLIHHVDVQTITPGDYDGNEVVDLDDFAYWDDCETGPDAGPREPECKPFDVDFDGDVDLDDYGGMQDLISEVPE
jgi:pyrrolidone-carboxylate peptidase